MKTKSPLFVAAAMVAALVSGCTFPSRGTVYDQSRLGRAMHLNTGDVIAVRDVVISGQTGPVGITGGGLVGHALGSTAGKGTGRAIAGAGGAVAGAILGGAVEEVATRRKAQEVTVKLSNGETIAVVQEIKDGPFFVGEHVQVLSGGATAVIKHMY